MEAGGSGCCWTGRTGEIQSLAGHFLRMTTWATTDGEENDTQTRPPENDVDRAHSLDSLPSRRDASRRLPHFIRGSNPFEIGTETAALDPNPAKRHHTQTPFHFHKVVWSIPVYKRWLTVISSVYKLL